MPNFLKYLFLTGSPQHFRHQYLYKAIMCTQIKYFFLFISDKTAVCIYLILIILYIRIHFILHYMVEFAILSKEHSVQNDQEVETN